MKKTKIELTELQLYCLANPENRDYLTEKEISVIAKNALALNNKYKKAVNS